MNARLNEFVSSGRDGLYYIGHSSALLCINGRLILFDPVWGDYKPYGDYWTFFPEQENCDEILDKVDAVIISHIHEDHICGPILEKINCLVHVMNGRPQLIERIEKYADVVVHTSFQWGQVFDGVSFYFVPHDFNSVDSSVFVKSSKFCAYLGSDNFLSKKLLYEIKEDLPKINVACVPYAFVHYYPHLLDSLTQEQKIMETQRLNDQSLSQAEMFCEVLDPQYVIGFGNNLFYIEGERHPVNRYLATIEDFAHASRMRTGGWLTRLETDAGKVEFELNYKENSDVFVGKQLPVLDFDTKDIFIDLAHIKKRLQRTQDFVKHHTLFVNDVKIDLETKEVSFSEMTAQPYTRFKFDKSVFREWVNGKITFEQAIGTRRFRYWRMPNIYNLEVIEFYNKWL